MKNSFLIAGFVALFILSASGLQSQVLVNRSYLVTGAGSKLTVYGSLVNEANGSLSLQGDLSLHGNLVNNKPAVTIGGNTTIDDASVISGAEMITFNNLTISESGVLQIGESVDENQWVTVTGNFINDAGTAGLIIKDNSSLISNSPGIGGTVEHVVDGNANIWHLLSSPVAAQAITTFSTAGEFFGWDEPSQSYAEFAQTVGYPNWSTINGGSDNFIAGKGYFVKYNNAPVEFDFTGTLNQGAVTFPVTGQSSMAEAHHGFNLAGNPYPSFLDWKSASGWTRSDLAEVSQGGQNYAYWVWNGAAGNYGTFISDGTDESGTNGVSRYISPKQGFWVNSAAETGSLVVDNQARTHANQPWLKSIDQDPSSIRFRLSCTENTFYDEMILEFFVQNGKAPKLFSSVAEAPEIFAYHDAKAGSILRYSEIPAEPIALGVKAGKTATYHLQASINGLNSQIVLLEDKLTGQVTDLRENNKYTFLSEAKFEENRFLLHFGGLGEAEIAKGQEKVYFSSDHIVIDATYTDANAEITVFDIRGIKIATYRQISTGKNMYRFNSSKGVYLVNIKGANPWVHKVVVY